MDAAVEIEQRAAPRGRGRRIISFVVVAALTGILAIVSFEGFRQSSSINQMSTDVVAPFVPAAPTVVCRSIPTAACAGAAASIAQLPSAWMEAPAGYQLAEYFAWDDARGGARTQMLFLPNQGGSAQVTLDSAAQMQPRFSATRTVTAGANSGVLSELTLGGNVVESQLMWTHAGHSYALLWIGAQVDSKVLIAEWNAVRYASPTKP